MLKTLLLTDIVDSTSLTETIGDERMSKIWVEHDNIARGLLSEYNGVEADRTDGFLMLFDSQDDACNYAIALNSRFDQLSAKENIQFQARIGIHTGDIILIETSDEHRSAGVKHIEVEGLAKPAAARIMSIARGGQILLSEDAFNRLNGNFRTHSFGNWRMKGVEEPIQLYEVGDENTHFHPPEDSEKVYRVNLVDGIWEPVKETKHNLTAERDQFVGRKEDLHTLSQLVNISNTKLLTILGPGGTGKTRISKRFGRMWLGDYPGGVWFCDLADCRSLEGIATAVGAALDVRLNKGDTVAQLGSAIQGRGNCLIILDNFEQITDFADQTLGRWLEDAPNAKFVVTSRNLLNLPGERTMELHPLPVDEDGLLLFEARAIERKSSFSINDENRGDVIHIVQTLDGLPLAIELAAARVSVLSPSQIKERLKQRFKLLAGKKGVSKRQQTLRAAIDWSWDIMEDWERAAFAQCSVFEGGFTLEAAEEVLDLSAFQDAPMNMDAVQALVDKSLIRSDVQRYDINELWFGFYGSLHEYCKEKFNEKDSFPGAGPDLITSTRNRHLSYFSNFGTKESIAALYTHGCVLKRKALNDELDNLLVAFDWAIAIKDQEQAALVLKAIWEVVRRTGPHHLVKKAAETVIELDPDNKAIVLMMIEVLLRYASNSPDIEIMNKYEKKGQQIASELDDRHTHALVILSIAFYYNSSSRTEEAEELIKNWIEEVKGLNDPILTASYYYVLGSVTFKLQRIEEALNNIDKALQIAVESGNIELQAGIMDARGSGLQMLGDFQKSSESYLEALSIAEEIENLFYQVIIRTNIARCFIEMKQFEKAIEYLTRAVKLAKENGDERNAGIALETMGRAHCGAGNYEDGIATIKEGIRIFTEGNYIHSKVFALVNLGWEEQKVADHKNALQTFEESLKISKELSLNYGIGLSYWGFGGTYSLIEQHNKALEYFQKADQHIEGKNIFRLKYYTQWTEALLKAGDNELAKEKLAQIDVWLESLNLTPNTSVWDEIERVRSLIAET